MVTKKGRQCLKSWNPWNHMKIRSMECTYVHRRATELTKQQQKSTTKINTNKHVRQNKHLFVVMATLAVVILNARCKQKS